MTKTEATKKMVAKFKAAGWAPLRTVGSHTSYGCPCPAKHRFSLPDGHKTISAGVVRKAEKALKECQEGQR